MTPRTTPKISRGANAGSLSVKSGKQTKIEGRAAGKGGLFFYLSDGFLYSCRNGYLSSALDAGGERKINRRIYMNGWRHWKRELGGWLNSSVRERQRILWLLPMLVLLCLLFLWQGKPRFERSFTLYSDAVIENRQNDRNSMKTVRPADVVSEAEKEACGSVKNVPGKASASSGKRPYTLFAFDPNTIDLNGLVDLGFSPKQAQVILNYRQAGAVFRRPEDFARCYTVSSRKYAELEPYIRIGEAYRRKTDRASADPTGRREVGALLDLDSEKEGSKSVSESSLQKDSVRDVEGRGKSVGNGVPSTKFADEKHSSWIELNTADSATLVGIRGIGPLTAGRILRYRERLGGFVRVEQLLEVQGMREENYRMILTQIFVDSSKIQKIDINFATPEQLTGHPYLPPRVLDKILKDRQLKGGWSNAEELVKQHILSREQAVRLAPYLRFETR